MPTNDLALIPAEPRPTRLTLRTGEPDTGGKWDSHREPWRQISVGWDSRRHTPWRCLVDVPGSTVELWMGRKRRDSGRRLDCSDALRAVTPQSLNAVLLDPVIASSLADHLQATRQGRLSDKLTGPASCQEFIF
jgi:hypothetical protein